MNVAVGLDLVGRLFLRIDLAYRLSLPIFVLKYPRTLLVYFRMSDLESFREVKSLIDFYF